MNTQTTPEIRPSIEIVNGELKTTSLKIAEHFGKRHDDVLKKIQNLECSPEFRLRNFAETVIERENPSGGQPIKSPAYEITRDGFAFLAMGFTGKRAAQWKEAYITAFNAMAEQLARPQIAETDHGVTLTFPKLENGQHRRWLITQAKNEMVMFWTLANDQEVMSWAEFRRKIAYEPTELQALIEQLPIDLLTGVMNLALRRLASHIKGN